MDVLSTLKKLPELCFTVLPSDQNQLICIKRGVPGYFPVSLRSIFDKRISAQQMADQLNEGIAPEVVEAMIAGSMFGWDVPAADPDVLRAQRATKH